MKKVININFQGRVVPIEETAYEILKQYVESLRRYFANEEGRDEIINDIESRIAELFSERLKKGAVCITDEDVNAVILSMGRPEDFEAQNGDEPTASTQSHQQYSGTYSDTTGNRYAKKSLVRNADDKILGGVCSGLANYFGIDPVIMRILFVLLFSALFWVYILLWIIVPAKSVQSNITKRLYRNPDDKVFAGVAGGLAAYFNIEPWIPRLVFALPFVLGILSGTFNNFWWDNDFGFFPRVIFGSFGSTLLVTYIVLWVAVPLASNAAERLEMKGEKVDLNSIRDTVKEDLEGVKSRAQTFSKEVKETAQNLGNRAKEFGNEAGSRAKAFAAETGPIARRTGSGVGYVIGVLFKAFFLFIAGVVAVALFGAFIGLLFGGFAVFPLKNFVLDGFWQNILAWTSLFLFFGIPLIGLITWLVRKIAGIRSKNNYLGYVFGSLWTIGLIATVLLAALVSRNFRTRSAVEEKITPTQPASGKMTVQVASSNIRYYGSDWFGIDSDEDWPIYGINQDTLMLNTVRVNVVKSPDSSFHLYKVKFGRGVNPLQARQIAERINFDIQVEDSVIILPKGFPISSNEKFRNQQVLVVLEVPVGKKVQLDESIDYYDWFTVNSGRRGWNARYDEDWERSYHWQSNREYVMTPDGLRATEELDQAELKNGRFKLKIDEHGVDIEAEGNFENTDSSDGKYRYEEKKNVDSTKIKVSVSEVQVQNISNTEAEGYEDRSSASHTDLASPLIIFSKLFQ